MLNTSTFLYLLDILSLLLLGYFIKTNRMMSARRKRLFTDGLVLTQLVILSELVSIAAMSGSAQFRILNLGSNMIGFTLSPLVPLALALLFNDNSEKIPIPVIIPTLINFVAVFLSPWYGVIFQVDSQNNYARGDYFFIFIVVCAFNIIYLVFNTMRECKKNLYPITLEIHYLWFFAAVGSSIQLFWPQVYLSWHTVTLTLFLLYILLSEFEHSFDKLTGLYNRDAFDKALYLLRNKNEFSVVMMDINDFKQVNDSFGHEYGDTALQNVARIIKTSFDHQCSWYRVGGDEFVVICVGAGSEGLQSQISRFVCGMSDQRQIDSHLPTISYGYSIFQKGKTPDVQTTLREADEQMYHYKKFGKDEKGKTSWN